MPSPDATPAPDMAEALTRVLGRAPRERRPLLIALAERLAAARYRAWAERVANQADRAELLACASREEEIAGRVEGFHPDAAAIQRELLAAEPDFEEINRRIFAGRSLAEELALQARGERLGAATWTAFAEREADAARRAAFLDCATREIASAVVLEGMLAAGGPRER